MLDKRSRWIAICEFDEKFDIWLNEDIILKTFSAYIHFDCEGYELSDTFTELKSDH